MQLSEESKMSEELLQQLGKFVVDSDIIKDGARSLFKKRLARATILTQLRKMMRPLIYITWLKKISCDV